MRYSLIIACAFAFPAGGALAAPLAYESFSHTPVGGSIEGKTSDSGSTWVSAYTSGVAPGLMSISSGSLALPSELPAPVGNSVQIDGGPSSVNTNPQQAGKSLRLPLSSAVAVDSGGTVYYSLALRVDELTGSNNLNGGFFAALNNGATATTTNPTAGGARLHGRIDPTEGTKFNLGIFRNVNGTAAAPSWSGPLTVGDTLFIVASYETVPGAQNDIARLWIDPDPSTFNDPSFSPLTTPPDVTDVSTLSGTDIGVASIILRQSAAPHVTLDELRVGTTWADVTVPEPAALGVLAVGAVGLLGRRRRRRANA